MTTPARRARVRDPKCRHVAHERRVTDSNDPREVCASTWVCARPGCVEDAADWVLTLTGRTALVFDTDGQQVTA